MLNEKLKVGQDKQFQNSWFSQYRGQPEIKSKANPLAQNFEEIKQYAYAAFDQLDKNGNGFIETSELSAALNDANMPMREKSFITFLLNHQREIADTVLEGQPENKDGISRLDLDGYFKLVLGNL